MPDAANKLSVCMNLKLLITARLTGFRAVHTWDTGYVETVDLRTRTNIELPLINKIQIFEDELYIRPSLPRYLVNECHSSFVIVFLLTLEELGSEDGFGKMRSREMSLLPTDTY